MTHFIVREVPQPGGLTDTSLTIGTGAVTVIVDLTADEKERLILALGGIVREADRPDAPLAADQTVACGPWAPPDEPFVPSLEALMAHGSVGEPVPGEPPLYDRHSV